jgi:hypothetical protein
MIEHPVSAFHSGASSLPIRASSKRWDAEELDRLQAAIDRRRRQLAGDEVVPSAGPSSTVVERRAYGSGVLQLEKRGESGPYWYFHHRKDGKQKSVYLGKTDAPEIKLAQLKGGIGG